MKTWIVELTAGGTMKTWIVELTAGGRNLVEAIVQRGIFERHALSPLLFVFAMMSLNN